eukprot:TRINITY_DN4000_c0_g1_i2.p1 TRINITY_DN4000_c0_g1~~TRINITY_DN4000_c0_g1_i2.p1  ORF type:complete len:180 (+),score=36.76 TRINITY_DN4000_c0_g1_i2:61-600(+)
MATFPKFEERSFTRYYIANVDGIEGHDQYSHRSINFILITGVANCHPLLHADANGIQREVTRIEYLVEAGDPDEESTWAKKKGTYRQVNPKTPLCKVYCTNGDEFIFYCGGTGYLIEFNERVLQDPTLLIRKPATEGFLALVLPKRGDEDASITGLMTEEAYCALRGVNIQRESLLTPS